jgi:hypothetical protein
MHAHLRINRTEIVSAFALDKRLLYSSCGH